MRDEDFDLGGAEGVGDSLADTSPTVSSEEDSELFAERLMAADSDLDGNANHGEIGPADTDLSGPELGGRPE